MTVRDALNRASLEIAKLEAHQEELLAKICDELRVSESARANCRRVPKQCIRHWGLKSRCFLLRRGAWK